MIERWYRTLIWLYPQEFRVRNAEEMLLVFIVLQAVLMSIIVTMVALLCYAVSQQMLRHGANNPQVQMARDAASELASGTFVAHASTPVDPSHSLAPFLIVYDTQGRPTSSSAVLDDKTPIPPTGMFDYARTHLENRVSWQPRGGVRIAAVIVPYQGGFVLSGRSLAEVEASERNILNIVILGWVGLLVFMLAGTAGVLRFASGFKQQSSLG